MLSMEFPYDPEILLISNIQEKWKHILTKTCTQMFLEKLFIIAKMWKQSDCPKTEWWIFDNQAGVYPHNRILLSNKRSELLIHATTWINLENIVREIN